MKDFEYFRAKTVEEACSLISRQGEGGKFLAGGQSLITLLRQKLLTPSYLVDIKGISDLEYIRFDDKKGLSMGGLTTHRAIERSPVIRKNYPVLSDMEMSMTSVQTRNWGTIGGNLCCADPNGDAAPALIALNARIKLLSLRGERTIPLQGFFTDTFATVIDPDELLTEIHLPPPAGHTGAVHMRFSTTESGIKVVSVSALITLDSGKRICTDARIVMGAVAPVPLNAERAGNHLSGKSINESLIEEAARLAGEEADPASDVHASAEYRREMAKVMVRRAVRAAFEKAKAAS